MLGYIRRSLSDIFFPPSSINLDPPPYDEFRDLDFDIYDQDTTTFDEKINPFADSKPLPKGNFLNFDSYDWAFSFRESGKSEQKVFLEVSVERIPKDPAPAYETCCLPVSPALSPHHTGNMTLLRSGSTSTAPARTPTFTETTDMISEEEQNMIMAAIIASQCDDFDRQIPRHIRDEMEHAEYIAALEESKELAERRSAPPSPVHSPVRPPLRTPAYAPVAATPPATPMRSSTFTASAPSRGMRTPATTSSAMSSPRGLTRSKTDIPWTSSKGQTVEGENEQQQKFRELLQFHAVAAASIANASARTGVSNISGNDEASEYDWV